MKLSVTIITFNEEKNIQACIESVKDVADEIIVIDSFSKDKTAEICKSYSKVKFIENSFAGHVEQKNFAINQSNFEFILSLDADERLSEKLKEEIHQWKNEDTSEKDAYNMPRLNNYCGKWIRHSGWYPDRKIRLWNKNKGEWGGNNPHDKVIMNSDSTIGKLKGDILHYTTENLKTHLEQVNKFSEIAAQQLLNKNKGKSEYLKIYFNPPFTFFKRYILQLGFLDGFYGFTIAIISAHAKFLKYAKFKQMRDQQSTK
ncbi:glycosyltransferase family 2 protein [Marivirga tractuosa]|uniref:glycosyltransferase family 2 protein n=1 Tax=Marivirga tractuosa TaxID=1006 RepID=UPI0035CEE610